MAEETISIKIKQTNNNQTYDVSIQKFNTILELKKACSEKSGLSETQQNLVYKGRILSDEKLVSDYSIGEGHTIILVKKASQEEKDKAKTTTEQTTASTGNLSSGTTNLFGNQGGMGNLGMPLTGLGRGINMPDSMDMNTALSMMNNPMYQQMMNTMLSNPEFLNTVLDNPQIKPMLDANPQLRTLFSNPQMLQALMNPQMIQSMMGMMGQSGQQTSLNTGNPFGNFSFPQPNNNSTLNNPSTNTESNSNSSEQTTNTLSTSQNTLPNQNAFNPFMINPFMFGGFPNPSPSQQQNVDPKEKYKEQNERLKEMGFINDEVNFQVLAKTGGNVDAAVERLLNMLN